MRVGIDDLEITAPHPCERLLELQSSGPSRQGERQYKVPGAGGLQGAQTKVAGTPTHPLPGKGGPLTCRLPGPAQQPAFPLVEALWLKVALTANAASSTRERDTVEGVSPPPP